LCRRRRAARGPPGAAIMTHVSCHDVITELWDYLDGELPVERAALIADHLAECARCYPQYRFEYAFLAAVPRQPAPRAAPPLRPRGPARGPGAAAERWALALLRLSLGVFLLFWGIAKLSLPA